MKSDDYILSFLREGHAPSTQTRVRPCELLG